MSKVSMTLRLVLYLSLIAVIFSIGFRADNIGTDTYGYIYYYNGINNGAGDVYKHEFIFNFLIQSFASLHISVGYFFSCLCFIFCCFCGLIASKINQSFDFAAGVAATFLLIMIFFFCSPFFFNSQINIIRQGISAAALILFYLYLIKPIDLIGVLFAAICAVGFHSTACVYILFAVLMCYSYLTILWLVVSLATCYTLGLTKNVLALIPNINNYNVLDKLIAYQNYYVYQTGRRFDFVCFTLGVGLIFHFLGKQLLCEKEKINFYLFLKIYWILVMPFFIVGFFAYSDRWLFNGWLYLSVLSAAFFSFFHRRTQDINKFIYIFILLSVYVVCKTKLL